MMLSSLDTPYDCRPARATCPRISRLKLALAIAALYSGAAVGAPEDAFHAYATAGFNYDDNLFRLADSNPGYDNTRADRSTQVLAGLSFKKTYGRQDLSVQAQVSRVTFDHFGQLDYNGKDVLGNWGWHLGNHLAGTAGVHYSEVLAPFTDVVTRDRNLRIQRHEYLTAGWTFHPSWMVRGAATHDRYTYDLLAQRYNDHDGDGVEAGLDYLAASGSTLGLQLNKSRYRYDQLRNVNGTLVDPGTDQDDVALKAYWRVTGVTNVQFLGGWSRRTHAYATERDSSGVNAVLKGGTQVGKLQLDASLFRQFQGLDNNLVSYGLSTGASVNGAWVISSKLRAEGHLRFERRSFRGLLLAAPAGTDFVDSTRNVTGGLTYDVLPSVQLTTSLYKESRHGLAALLFGNGSYHAKGVSFNANLQY